MGFVPFGSEETDVFQVYQEILKNDIEFPDWVEWDAGKDVIRQLLNKSPDGRIGGSISTFKAQKWFELINWDWVKRPVKTGRHHEQDH